MIKLQKITITLITFIFLFIPLTTFAEDKQRIFDEANMLSDAEIVTLEVLATTHSKKQDTDFVVLTTDGEHGIDIETYMGDFADDNFPGNAVLLGVDLKESDVMVMGFEKGKELLDNNRATKVREKVTPYLSDRDYVTAFETFIITSERYMRYNPGVNPDNIFFKTTWQLIIGIGLAALITFVMVRNVNPKVTTTAATYRNDQLTRILHKRDRYIRTTVTKKYRPRNKNSGGGGRGGGGSSFGRTSGGRSYSGSRGKF